MFHFLGTKHASKKQMIATMDTYCYWESLYHNIVDIYSSCVVCTKNKRLTKQHYSLILLKCVFYTISIDIMGPIKRSSATQLARYIIATIDHFTKWVEAQVITTPSARITANFISTNIIARHGCP